MGLLVDVTQVYLQLTSNDKTSIWRTPYSEKRPAGTVRTAAWLSSPFVASSLANIQWQQFRYMADAIQREDACQGELELLHGRRTARKTNAVKIATDVTQARLQVIASGNSAIWRTPYSEKRPAGTVRAAAWQTDVIQNWMRNRDVIEFLGLWEKLHNPSFNPLEFEGVKKQAGANAFTMSPKIIVKLEFKQKNL